MSAAKVMSTHCKTMSVRVPTIACMICTHRVKRSPMNRRLNNLNSSIIPNIHTDIRRQRDLRQAKRARVHLVGGTRELEDGDDGVRVVERFVAETHVYVDEGGLVTGEPAGLEGYGSAVYGPFCAVLGCADAAAYVSSVLRVHKMRSEYWRHTWVHPLLAVGVVIAVCLVVPVGTQ